MYINTYQCCGNLVANPQLLEHRGGPYAKFTIALNKPKQERPIYIDCIAWGNLGVNITEYCRKGQEIYVCGEIDVGSYVDSNGITRKAVSLKVREFSAGPSRRENQPAAAVPKPKRPWASQDRE
jgi:single-stranded DNA-binding protein